MGLRRIAARSLLVSLVLLAALVLLLALLPGTRLPRVAFGWRDLILGTVIESARGLGQTAEFLHVLGGQILSRLAFAG